MENDITNNVNSFYETAKAQGATDYEIASALGFLKVDQDGEVDYNYDGEPKVDVKGFLRMLKQNTKVDSDQYNMARSKLIYAVEVDEMLLDVGPGTERVFGITKSMLNQIIDEMVTLRGNKLVTIYLPHGEGLKSKVAVPILYKGDFDINYIWQHRALICTCLAFSDPIKGKHKSIQTVLFREALYRQRRHFLRIMSNLIEKGFSDDDIAEILMVSKTGVDSLKKEYLRLVEVS